MRLSILGLCALLLSGCNHPGKPPVMAISSGSLVVISPEPERLPFDPKGARLRAATDELSRTCGHPLPFFIEAALADNSLSGFESQLIDAIETMARELADLREHDPKAFAYLTPLLKVVACRYRATASGSDPRFDLETGTLELIGSPDSRSLVPQGRVRRAFEQSYWDYANARYANVTALSLPAVEWAGYFRYLDDTRNMNADLVGKGISEKRADRILKMFDLAATVGNSDPRLADQVRKWLFDQRSYFIDSYRHHAEALQTSPPAFRRAESAFVNWLNQQLPSMSETDKLSIARDAFLVRPAGQGYFRSALPGFDKLGFAFGVVNEWVRAGHPTQADGPRRNPLQEYIVCPHPAGNTGHRSMGPRCDYHLYRYALENEQDTRRLIDAVARSKDPILFETLFLAVRYAQSDAQTSLTSLWRMVEQQEDLWYSGSQVMAEEISATSDRGKLTDELRRLWRAYPSRRGALLYVVARADPYDNGDIDWGHFERDYGSLATASDFANYLDRGPHAMSSAHTTWPALGKGWSRAQVIVPRLDKFLSDPRAHAPRKAIDDIVKTMCAENAVADLAQLHGWLSQRIRNHPGDAFGDLLETISACKPDRQPASDRVRVRNTL